MAAVFLEKFLSLLGTARDPDAAKKKQVKQLARDITGNKYSRFYKIKSGEIDGSLGKFFYEMYKIISPSQVFMQNAAKSAQLKQITAEAFLDKNLQEIKARIGPEAIAERAKKTAVKDLGVQLKQELGNFSAAFDMERINAIDRCYNLILAFIQFVTFDFFFFLKKFDGNITERNFTYIPKFAPVRGEYLKEELKDFIDISFAVDPDQDWKNVFRVLKIYKNGVDVVAFDQWSRLLNQLRELNRSTILTLMIRHIEKNPLFQSKPSLLPDERIAEAYLESVRTEARNAVDKIVNAKKNAQIDVLAKTIFGAVEVDRMKHYTEKAGEIYLKKNFEGYAYVRGLNYLRAFLLDFFKKDIRELCDILLIRGQWTAPQLAQQMSGAFHLLMTLSDTIIAFDETFSDEGENGSRLKAAIVKADRDKSQARYITLILKTAGEEAQKMIMQSAQSLIIVGKNLKNLIDDHQKPRHDLLMNWKELEGASEEPLGQRMAAAYKKIYYFVQMMQFFASPPENEV
jgi:hypothetical protein